MALLRMVATYPWLIEVAEARFAPRFAAARVVTEAGRVLGNVLQTMFMGGELEHSRNAVTTSVAQMSVGSADRMVIGLLSRCSLPESDDGKTLSYTARASRIRRIRSRSAFGINRITSPIFASNGNAVFRRVLVGR